MKLNHRLIVTKDEKKAYRALSDIVRNNRNLEKYSKNIPHDNSGTLASLLEKIPVTSKNEMLKYSEEEYAVPTSRIVLFSETSGTTGKSLSTPRGKDEFSWNMQNQAFAYKQYLQPGVDRIAIVHPSIMSPFVEVSACALQNIGVSYLRIFPIPKICDYERIHRVLEDNKITAIMSTPTLVYKLLHEFKNTLNKNIPTHLKKVLLTGEMLSPASMKNMDNIIGHGDGIAKPFVYGSSEVATVMFGNSSGNFSGFLDDFIYEIIPTEYSNPNEGSHKSVTGNLHVTWLRKGILPIVRYNTEDIFTAWFDEFSHEWHFKPEGRNLSKAIPFELLSKIDSVVYNGNYNVYNYKIQFCNEHVKVSLVTDLNQNYDECYHYLAGSLDFINKKLIIDINDPENMFYDFSPVTKTNNFDVNSCLQTLTF